MEIGRFFSDPLILAHLKEKLDLSQIGERIKEASGKPRRRRHDLGKLIKQTYFALAADGREPTAEQIFNALEEHDEEEIIQEIYDDRIDWIDWRGNERTMKISTLRNRLTKLRSRGHQS